MCISHYLKNVQNNYKITAKETKSKIEQRFLGNCRWIYLITTHWTVSDQQGLICLISSHLVNPRFPSGWINNLSGREVAKVPCLWVFPTPNQTK